MSMKSKRILLYSLYGTICFTFVIGTLIVKNAMNSNEELSSKNISEGQTIKTGSENKVITVFEEKNVISKPYIDTDVVIGLNFYNSKDEKINQEDSLIYYENTYMPSTGIFYKREKEFNVVSVYNGKIKEITKSDLLGNIIEVDYGNNLIGIYQCIDNIKVNVGDEVSIGSVLATSSNCNIFKEIGFYFELIHNGKNLNPEYYYGKTIEN